MEDNKNIIEKKLNFEEIPASEEAAETAAQEPKARPKGVRLMCASDTPRRSR